MVSPHRHPIGDQTGVMVWQWPTPRPVLSSAPVGGGHRFASWLLNIGVPIDYARTDLAVHAQEIADELALSGEGVTLLTAADVRMAQRSEREGVTVDATVGISKPTWAADPDGGYTPWSPGTINLVIEVPVALSESAAVNVVITATEAKTQALFEAGVPGTGTASDAIVVIWSESGPTEDFAGPRSVWGSHVALAVHDAVTKGVIAAASPLERLQ
ncbi:MAG: adenosylcobinamide amidohydrolase [Acidimicrobiales bacterium]